MKDTGRAVALLQLAEHLKHRTHNVASGRSTTNAEIIAATTTVVPDADVDLPSRTALQQNWLDITRIHDDTGYAPAYDTARAAGDYIAWLRAGNAR